MTVVFAGLAIGDLSAHFAGITSQSSIVAGHASSTNGLRGAGLAVREYCSASLADIYNKESVGATG